MKLEEFQRIVDQHGGVASDPVVLDPPRDVKTTDRYGRETTEKNVPVKTPRYRYVFKDGTTITAITQESGDIQVTDPGTAMKPTTATGQTPAQAETERANRAREAETAKRNAQTAANQSGQAARADRTQNRLITAQEAAAELARIREERTANIAERGMDVTEANARAKAKYDALDQHLKQAEAQRAVEAARRDEEKARFEREKYQQDQISAREKEDTRRREADRTFAYSAGQDAVSNEMKLMPYRVGPTFGAEFSKALNTITSGGGPISFSPDAFTYQMPDLDAMATRAAQQAMALYNLPVSTGGATAPAPTPALAQALATRPVTPPLPLPANQAQGYTSMPPSNTGVVPPATPANRDQWAR